METDKMSSSERFILSVIISLIGYFIIWLGFLLAMGKD